MRGPRRGGRDGRAARGPVPLEALTANAFTFVLGTGGSFACDTRCSASGSGHGPITVSGTGGSFDTSDSRLTGGLAFDAGALVLRVEPLP